MTNLSGINLNNGSAVGAKREAINSPNHSLALIPKYEDYVNSGVEWLGDIPSSWKLKPGFVAFSESKTNNKGMKENTVLSLSYGNIVVKPEEKLVGLVPESFETYQLVEPDDIIVRCTDLQNDKVSLRTGLAKNKGIITNAYLNLRVKNGFNARFLHYYLHALDTTKVLYKFGSGLRQNLSFLDFKRLPIFEIPEDTQKLISNYLDHKTTQIDDAIAIKEQQISLLKERKQIIIQQVVTQGLDPNIPVKDSGVDWIGKIPAHWEVRCLKLLINSLGDVDHYMPKTLDTGIPYFMTGDLKEFVSKMDFTNCKKVSEHDFKQLSKKIRTTRNDVILARYATVGTVAFVDVDTDFLVSYSCVTIKPNPKKLLGLFLFYYLRSDSFAKAINVLVNTNTQGNVGISDLKKIKIALPSVSQQKEIIDVLKTRLDYFDKALILQDQQIQALKEYKTTLINSAVTGKIKITPEMVE